MEQLRTIEIPDTLVAWLHEREGMLRPDVSRYAKGRQRQWLVAEWALGAGKRPEGSRFKRVAPEFQLDGRLWKWILRVCEDTERPEGPWTPDIGLVTYSGEQAVGISLHRDDSVSNPEAWAIQITGTCQFTEHLEAVGFTTKRRPRAAVEIQTTEMTPGMVCRFNCKNPHEAHPSPHRWAINLWTVKAEYRNEFLVITEQGGVIDRSLF